MAESMPKQNYTRCPNAKCIEIYTKRELLQMVDSIFGSDFLQHFTRALPAHSSQQEFVQVVKVIFNYNLTKGGITGVHLSDNIPGRKGPLEVYFDRNSASSPLEFSNDLLTIVSHSNFTSVKANTSVFSGKWHYEVHLGTSGVMHIGWASNKDTFTDNNGVGDSSYSYGFDGRKKRKWNLKGNTYGDTWYADDIIGTTIDLDTGSIHFYRNGKDLGEAFNNISRGKEFAYVPAVSLTFGESLKVNFGSYPIVFPVEGFRPLQKSPDTSLKKAYVLTSYIKMLLDEWEKDKTFEERNCSRVYDDVLKSITEIILTEALMVFSNRYVVSFKFCKLLEEICTPPIVMDISSKLASVKKMNKLFDLIWASCEISDINCLLRLTLDSLLSKYRTISPKYNYSKQKKILWVLLHICTHPLTRKYLISNFLFEDFRLLNFMHTRALDDAGLESIIKVPWWEEDEHTVLSEEQKFQYNRSIAVLVDIVKGLEDLHTEILNKLLNADDAVTLIRTSRGIFITKLRHFLSLSFLNKESPFLVPYTIHFSFFSKLCSVVYKLWCKKHFSITNIPTEAYYDGSVNFYDVNRLGGMITFLNRDYSIDLIEDLGEGHIFMSPFDYLLDDTSTLGQLILDQCLTQFKNLEMLSLIHLLDDLIVVYHFAAHKQLLRSNELTNSISEVRSSLNRLMKKKNPSKQTLHAREVLLQKLMTQSRQLAWIKATIHRENLEHYLMWLLKLIFETLKIASTKEQYFSFIPQYYVEVMNEIITGLKNHIHPIAPLENFNDFSNLLVAVADLLCMMYKDRRLIHPYSKTLVVQMLASFASSRLTMTALENVAPSSAYHLLKNLLKPYDDKLWAQTNWVLGRFWQGQGFAFRYCQSPHLTYRIEQGLVIPEPRSTMSFVTHLFTPTPSSSFQSIIGDILDKDDRAATLFVNTLLNHLNWTFSEFMAFIQEFNAMLDEPYIIPDTHICTTWFDLTISLLRVIEMVVNVTKSLFLDIKRNETGSLIERLCQSLCQILNFVCKPDGTFERILDMKVPDMYPVDHFPILAAVMGILVSLTIEDCKKPISETDIPRPFRVLLLQPNFNFETLQYLIQEQKRSQKRTFSFLLYSNDDALSRTELQQILKFIKHTKAYLGKKISLMQNVEDDDNVCTICYASLWNVVFSPCQHHCCRGCIAQHLMNSKFCFFCKTTIEKAVTLSGEVIYDEIIDPDEAEEETDSE